MPFYTTTDTDGITSETRVIFAPPRSSEQLRKDHQTVRAMAEEQNQRCTFDGRVADLEKRCWQDRSSLTRSMQIGGAEILVPIPPVYGSRGWYAAEILQTIQAVREAYARGDHQLALSEAVVVGALAAEAEAKHHWSVVQLGIKRRRDTQRAGRGRGKQARQKAEAADPTICRLVTTYQMSQEVECSLVAFIATRLTLSEKTVRRRLKRLQIAPR